MKILNRLNNGHLKGSMAYLAMISYDNKLDAHEDLLSGKIWILRKISRPEISTDVVKVGRDFYHRVKVVDSLDSKLLRWLVKADTWRYAGLTRKDQIDNMLRVIESMENEIEVRNHEKFIDNIEYAIKNISRLASRTSVNYERKDVK